MNSRKFRKFHNNNVFFSFFGFAEANLLFSRYQAKKSRQSSAYLLYFEKKSTINFLKLRFRIFLLIHYQLHNCFKTTKFIGKEIRFVSSAIKNNISIHETTRNTFLKCFVAFTVVLLWLILQYRRSLYIMYPNFREYWSRI